MSDTNKIQGSLLVLEEVVGGPRVIKGNGTKRQARPRWGGDGGPRGLWAAHQG